MKNLIRKPKNYPGLVIFLFAALCLVRDFCRRVGPNLIYYIILIFIFILLARFILRVIAGLFSWIPNRGRKEERRSRPRGNFLLVCAAFSVKVVVRLLTCSRKTVMEKLGDDCTTLMDDIENAFCKSELLW